MISLVTTCDPPRLCLLPWFVSHYRACGVEAFYISLHFDSGYAAEERAELADRASALLGELGLRLHAVYSCPYDAAVNRRHHDSIQSRIAADSPWIVWADIDEFHEYSDGLSQLTAYMRAHSVDYVEGFLVDRMAREGLPALRADVSPWRQFPLGTDITWSVLGGWVEKIMLARSDVSVGRGNHRVMSPESARRLAGAYPVHHFKWDASVIPRLNRRLEDDWKQRCPWWHESENALKWIAGGRGDGFAGLSVYDFQDDCRGDDGGPFAGNMSYASNQVKARLKDAPAVKRPARQAGHE